MKSIGAIHPSEIGFDIDGVVADTGSAFLRILQDEYGINSYCLENITEFTVENCLDVDTAIITDIFGKLHRDPIGCGLRPMTGAEAILKQIGAQSSLFFVTARSYFEPIAHWLHRLLGDFFSVTRLVVTGDHDDKASHIQALGLSVFVDDRAKTCRQLDAAGIQPIVFSQPWNRGRHSFPAVADWRQLGELLCLDQHEQKMMP